ncbi:MAG: prenyltransferase [SAR324 cluster bacterium]|nr:prenyltransferase [SAR324 cluster bacterium]
MTLIQKWIYALKPASWPKLLVPCLLGQSIGIMHLGQLHIAPMLLGLIYTVFLTAFIVFMNDWADQDTDAIKRSLFPDGCSPKTIPDKILPASSVLKAGIAMGVLAGIVSILGGFLLDKPETGWWGILGILIFYSYSFGPLKLNYRGGGELLEMLGTGFVLPAFNTFLLCGEAFPRESFYILPVFGLLCMGSAIASGFSDEESDRMGGKRTIVTMWGNRLAKIVIRRLVQLAMVCGLLLAMCPQAPVSGVLELIFVLIMLHYATKMRMCEFAVVTNAFAVQGLYKTHLHKLIWYSHIFLSLVFMMHPKA